MILYKYKANSEFTDKIFTDKKVWLATAAALNDPFECTIGEIAKDWIDKEINKLKSGHIGGFVHGAIQAIKNRELFYGLNPKQTKEFLKKFGQKDLDGQHKTVRDFTFRKVGKQVSNPEETFINFDKQLSAVGIFSLSEVYDNDLMWGHYGDSSRGIAIGFEVGEGTKLADPNSCIKVVYSNSRPTFSGNGFRTRIHFFLGTKQNIQDISFEDETFQLAISTKKEMWSYEKEWRYIEEVSGLYEYPGLIKELIFGLNCSGDKKKNYVNLISKNLAYPVSFFEMFVPKGLNHLERRPFNVP